MTEQGKMRSVLGKRLREQPSKPFHHTQLPSITENSTRSPSEETTQNGSAKKLRTFHSPGNASESSQDTGGDVPVSERTKRAHRRASLVSDTVSRSQTRSSTQPDRKRVAKNNKAKTTCSTQAVESLLRHVSDTSNPHSSSIVQTTRSSLRRKHIPRHLEGNIVKSSKVIKASKEYKAAEEALSPLWSPYAVSSPTVENNMFSRQLSVSEQGQCSPKPSPHAGNQSSGNRGNHAYVESESESPQFAKGISQNGTTRKRSIDFASPPTPSQEIIDHDAPLAEFTRRISHAALALGKRGYDSAGSDDASNIEEIPIGEPETRTTVDAAESSIAATLKEMMEGVLRKLQMQEETTRTTEERMKLTEERIKLESQRLATMIATQPPSAPPQAQASQERELLYELAKTAALHGAEKARVVYQNTFCGGNLPTMVQLRELVTDVDQTGNLIHPALMWQMLIEPQQFPQYFYSTRPWIAHPWRSTLTVPRTQEEIFACLKADEARYRSAFWASNIQMKLGGNIERQGKSRFPLHEAIQRAQRSQLQQQQPISHAPETFYFKAHVANVPGFAQSIVVEQPYQPRKPSWMMDIDENKREETPRPAPNRSWNQSIGIHFATLEQPQASGQSGPKNSNLCQHFAQGNCRFGDRCKKSHDLSGQTAQNGSNSGKTKQLNEELQALFRGFNRLNDMSFSELQGNGAIDLFVEFVNDHAAKLLEKITFASDKEVAQSLFANDAVQGMAKRLNEWWAQISRGILKPNNLCEAITSLDLLLSKANQKMAQSGVVASQSQGNFSQVNYFQSAVGNDQAKQGQGNGGGNNNNNVSNNDRGKNGREGSSRSANNGNGRGNNNNRGNRGNRRNGQNNTFNPTGRIVNGNYLAQVAAGILSGNNFNGNGRNGNGRGNNNNRNNNNSQQGGGRGGRGSGRRRN
ncbi:hypothetical protein BDU57DRAFT_78366 [Ampelomyces quisqualis]|uniref:C3H1-type domain-containing protein n=1 Tax=Ampelomyces quisqualis TaxID=50730 RepID=A0A6A5QB78_AMPQU|nr:hypothetical protein BDU57DRAFT_78366 [Ampelomyces quisqualis]